LTYALVTATTTQILLGNYSIAKTLLQEAVALTDERGVLWWKSLGTMLQGWLLASTGNFSAGVQEITSGIAAHRSTGSTNWLPFFLSHLARAHGELGQVEEAKRCAEEATEVMNVTNERWYEAEIHRTAGEIALRLSDSDGAKAEAHFKHALSIARQQQAKSWELRIAMSMARLWCDQGKRKEARDLLAPVYGWFTEGFDTLDLKEAKAMLEELAA
jgi:predicted ATPase